MLTEPTLTEHVDAEPAHVRDRVREVHLSRVGEPLLAILGDDAVGDALGLDAGERLSVQTCQTLRQAGSWGTTHLDVQVGALSGDQLSEPPVELGHDRRACRWTSWTTPPSSSFRSPRSLLTRERAPPDPVTLHRTLARRLQSGRQVGAAKNLRPRRPQAPVATRRQTVERSAIGSNGRASSRGATALNMPSSRPRCTAHTSSRCSSSRSRKGQSRRVMSTVFGLTAA